MSTRFPKSIHGINVTEEQYDALHIAQAEHDGRCQLYFDEYGRKCDESQKILDALWEKFCDENRRVKTGAP